MKNDYMNISVVRISLFVSNNYNMVVIYQSYTSIKYARCITILKHGGYRFNQPETTTDSESSWKSESYIRISEVDGCLSASSYISNRNLMYELAGDFT